MADIVFKCTSLFFCNHGFGPWQTQKMWYRFADIIDGSLHSFILDNSLAKCHQNRDFIPPFVYSAEHAEIDDVICLYWETEDDGNGGKDRVVTAERNDDYLSSVIGVVDCPKFQRSSIKKRNKFHPILYRDTKGMAVLCCPEDISNGQLRTDLLKLPKYNIRDLPTSRGVGVYRMDYLSIVGKHELPPSRDVLWLKPLSLRIKDFILQNYTSKQHLDGLSRTARQTFRNNIQQWLKSVEQDEKTILAHVGCTSEELRNEFRKLFRNGERFGNPTEIDVDFLISLIEESKELSEMVLDNWRNRNNDQLMAFEQEKETLIRNQKAEIEQLKRTHQSEVDRLKSMHLSAIKEMNEINTKKSILVEEKNELETDIKEKRGLRDEIEKEIKKLLSDVTHSTATTMIRSALQGGVTPIVASQSKGEIFQEGPIITTESPAENKDDALEFNFDFLKKNGRKELLYFMESTVLNVIPLLLIGRGGIAVAHSISASFFGKKADVLHCHGEVDLKLLDEVMNNERGILAIIGGINSAWMDEILIRLSACKKSVLFIVPMIDDVIFIPRGLFEYAVPLKLGNYIEDLSKYDEHDLIEYACKDNTKNDSRIFKRYMDHQRDIIELQKEVLKSTWEEELLRKCK